MSRRWDRLTDVMMCGVWSSYRSVYTQIILIDYDYIMVWRTRETRVPYIPRTWIYPSLEQVPTTCIHYYVSDETRQTSIMFSRNWMYFCARTWKRRTSFLNIKRLCTRQIRWRASFVFVRVADTMRFHKSDMFPW